MAKRLNSTALAKRRYDAAQMNLAGMTLAQIGQKLGVDPATVCRDLAWVRQEWRKGAVENFDQARALELAKLNHLEKCCWQAWERSQQDKVTRIEVRSTPEGGYTREKRETQAGKPSLLEGVFQCISKRMKLLEPGRRNEKKGVAKRSRVPLEGTTKSTKITKEEEAGAKRSRAEVTEPMAPLAGPAAPFGESRASVAEAPLKREVIESAPPLQPIHCVVALAETAAPLGESRVSLAEAPVKPEVIENAPPLQPIHCVGGCIPRPHGKRIAAPRCLAPGHSTAKRLHKRRCSPMNHKTEGGNGPRNEYLVEPLRGSRWRADRTPGCARRPWAVELNRFAVLRTPGLIPFVGEAPSNDPSAPSIFD